MFDPLPRAPAPELTPEQLLTTYEFGIHEPEYDTTEVNA